MADSGKKHLVQHATLTKPLSALKAAIVDDDPVWLGTLSELLVELRVSIVFTAANAVDAIVRFRTADVDIDVAFVDLGLPDFDGVEIAKLVVERHPRVALLACTGVATESRIEEARRAGFGKVLIKPVDLHELVSTLNEVRGLYES